MGMIYVRPGSRFLWIRYYRDGRGFSESTRSPHRRAAQRLLRLRESQSDQGVPVTPKIGRVRFD